VVEGTKSTSNVDVDSLLENYAAALACRIVNDFLDELRNFFRFSSFGVEEDNDDARRSILSISSEMQLVS
jgi:hypothetical protein